MSDHPNASSRSLPGSKYLVAVSCSIAIEPALSQEETKSVFDSVRDGYPEISNFSKDEDGHAQRINNGPDIGAKDEIYVKSVRGEELQIVWGPDALRGVDVLTTILEQNRELLTPNRITSFDHNLRYDVPYKGNHYELFSEVYYAQETVGALYRALSGVGARVNDNDIKLLMSTPDSEVVLVNITGRTLRSEAATGVYEERDIRLFIGVLRSKPSLLGEDLAVAVPRHIERVQARIADLIAPAVLAPLLDKLEGR